MKISETINRGFNLLGASLVALPGFAFVPEIFLEKDWDDKADDIGLLVIGIVGIMWYLTGNNRTGRSITPVVLVILALLVKAAAVFIEFRDKEAVGDDYGALILFVLATLFVIYQYVQTKKLLRTAEQT